MARIVICLLFLAVAGAAFLPAENLVGTKAPDLEVGEWIGGGRMTLTHLQGRVTAVLFWATWSPASDAALPGMIALGNRFKGRMLSVVALTPEEDRSAVAAYTSRRRIQFSVGLAAACGDAYGAETLPRLVIIDQNGTIQWEGFPLDPAAGDTIENLLDNPPSSSSTPSAPSAAETPEVEISSIFTREAEQGGADGEAADPRTAFLEQVKELRKDVKAAATDEVKAMGLFEKLRPGLKTYKKDQEVINEILKTVGDLVTGAEMNIRQAAARFVSEIENNDFAASLLIKSLGVVANRGPEYKDLQQALITGLTTCGRYSERAAAAVMDAFSRRAGTERDIRHEAIRALGEIRTMKSVELLAEMMPKICPNPAHPEYYYVSNLGSATPDRISDWDEVSPIYYGSLNALTGESMSLRWSYSDIKIWLNKNKAGVARRLAQERMRAEQSE